MNPHRRPIPLPRPLLEVRIARVLSREAARESDWNDRLLESYARGRIEGENSLGQQLVQQRSELQELQNGVLSTLRSVVPQISRHCQSGLVELALEVARKLVAGLPISSETVEAAVREALAEVEDTSDLRIELNAEDLALLRHVNSPTFLEAERGDRLRFETSAEIGRGGCRVHTRFGVIDARRETKFELIKQSLAA